MKRIFEALEKVLINAIEALVATHSGNFLLIFFFVPSKNVSHHLVVDKMSNGINFAFHACMTQCVMKYHQIASQTLYQMCICWHNA